MGASAALVGLVFVGISINLARIMAIPSLPGRALQAVISLLTVLVVASLLLVPGEGTVLKGVQVLVVGVVDWALAVALQADQWPKLEAQYRPLFLVHVFTGQLASLPFVIAGIGLITRGNGALYWLVPGVILSFLDASESAWVLLIEINR